MSFEDRLLERIIPYDVTYMWNLKHDTKELIYRTKTESQIQRLVVVKEEGERGRMDWELGISTCKLLHKRWINNKALLYSTEL